MTTRRQSSSTHIILKNSLGRSATNKGKTNKREEGQDGFHNIDVGVRCRYRSSVDIEREREGEGERRERSREIERDVGSAETCEAEKIFDNRSCLLN